MAVFIIAQVISIIGMVISFLSFQQKTKSKVISLQLISTLMFFVNMVMLGGIVGGILNLIAAIRALLFVFKDKFKADSIWWFLGFLILYVGVYVFQFTALKMQPTAKNLIIEVLPVIGIILTHIGFMCKSAKMSRLFCLINSPCWLVYNCIIFTIGGIIGESLNLISIILGIIRLDIKKQKPKEESSSQEIVEEQPEIA